jgi:4-amino-4-deoxy-L-arabinose transferase-like glycosyltransferase
MSVARTRFEPWTTRQRRGLFGLLVLSTLIRLGLLFSLPTTGKYLVAGIPHRDPNPPSTAGAYLDRRTDYIWLTEDEHAYDEMARSVLRGGGIATDEGWMVAPPRKPSSYGGFVYPAFVTAVYFVSGGSHQTPVFLLQIFLAVLSIVVVAQLGTRLFGATAGLLAAVLYGLSPFVIWSSVAMMTEAVFLPLVCWSTWALVDAIDTDSTRAWAFAGLSTALACLVRSTRLYFLPLALLLRLLDRRSPASLRVRLRGPVFFAVVFACTVAPWTIRNYQVHRRFLLLDTKAGASLWQYNNPNMIAEFGIRSAMGEPPIPITPALTVANGGNEVDQDRAYKAMAVAYVLRQPGHFLSVLFCRAVLAISPLPVTNTSLRNIVVGLFWKGSLLLLAIVGWLVLRARWRTGAGVLLGLPIYWWALQAVSGPGQRYRLPVDFVYAVLAAGGMVWLIRKLHHRRQGTR